MAFLNEKKRYLKIKLKTADGRFDIFLGSFVAGFVIVNFTNMVFAFLETFFGFLKYKILITYFSYLVYGLLWMPLGYAISWINTKVFKILKELKRRVM